MKYPDRDLVVILTPLLNMSQLLSKVYGLSHREADALVRSEFLEVSWLLYRFHLPNSISNIEHRQYTFFMCLVASFLITQADGKVSSLVMEAVVQTIRDKRWVMPLVLVKTLSGLDYVKVGH